MKQTTIYDSLKAKHRERRQKALEARARLMRQLYRRKAY